MKMEVFDINFVRYGQLQKYSFIQYSKKFTSCGSFEIKCPATEENIELLKDERIIWFESNIAGIIQYIEKDREDSTTLDAKGNLIAVILDWRYVYPMFQMTGSPDSIMESCVTTNCISNSDTKRNFPFLEVEASSLGLTSISKQQTGDEVSAFLTEVSEANEIGFEVGFYPKEQKMKFKCIKGTDRTVNNTLGNSKVMFSQKLDNIIKSEYIKNVEPFRNVTLVAGESSGTERTTLEVDLDSSSSGFTRRELYTDARDLQSTSTDDSGFETTLTTEEYNALLNQRGLEKLAECKIVESFTGEVRVDSRTTFKYGKDYFLGDTVTIEDTELAIRINAIVSGVTVTQDSNGYTIEPEFGYGQPTLYEKLKKKGVL